MEKRSRRRIRDLVAQPASLGLSENEIGCARISMVARNTNVPFKGRIQKRKTYHLQIITFRLQRAAGPYRMCQTGFQYTPVASIATCVHPAFSSHSASTNNPCVVVGKRRTSCPTFLFMTTRRQATTSALCTSRPAHLLCNVFIATSLRRGRHEALAL